MVVTFTQIDNTVAQQLLDFACRKNLGREITIEGKNYQLDYISRTFNAYHRARGLSIYYRVERSVVRLSDHWSKSKNNDRSRKFNCGFIDDQFWILNNKHSDFLLMTRYSGKYPFKILAGKAGLNQLNQHCEHWKN